MSFSEDFTFTRGTGATRINAAGLIVGVDFSSTSNTIGTGAKTFTLTADLNVNRDWPVGSAVRVVDQVSGNTMEGTVTTYTPSTQALVLDITSVTGAGTFTNWRIGSLEVRRDADGVLREPMRSNLLIRSNDFANAPWVKSNTTIETGAVNLFGSVGVKLTENTANAQHQINYTITQAAPYTISVYAKNAGRRYLTVSRNTVAETSALFDLQTGTIITAPTSGTATITPMSDGWYRLTFTEPIRSLATILFFLSDGTTLFPSYTGDGVSGVHIFQAGLESGTSVTSPIPTTTVAVTRNADTFTFTSSAIAKFRQAQGALVIEANASDAGTAQRAALRLTGPSGEIRIGKQGVATSGNFTKMAEGGDVQLLGTATGNSIVNSGLQYAEQSLTNARTGLPINLSLSFGFAYNGSNQFGRLFTQGESLIDSALTQIITAGVGGITITGCHHNGSRFLMAFGEAGLVGISTDGLGYRLVNTPVITQGCNEVTSGLVGPTLRNVIVGNAGFIATSDDNGETWVSRTSGVAGNFIGVTRGDTNFVAVSSTANTIRYSADGITWNGATVAEGQGLIDVAYNGTTTLVAVGNNGALVYSTNDGVTWTNGTSGTTQNLNGVHYNASAGLWVAVGNAGTIITATDPTGTWTLQTSGTAQNLTEVNYFNGLWVAVGASNTVITSPNAVTWTSRTANISATINGVAASGSRLIITGTAGGFASSEDGLTYTSRTNNNATLNGIAYGAGVYVSVGNAVNGSGYIATIDGAGTVTRRVSGTTQSIFGIRFLGTDFFAASQNNAQVLKSSDGITWVSASLGIVGNDFAYDGVSTYVAVGTFGTRSVSTNGNTWVSGVNGVTTQALNGIHFANGHFVIVGNAGVILTTTNGTTYTLRTSGTTQNLTSVMYSQRDQRWYAAGNAGTLLYSEDNGVTWASVNNAGFGAVSNTTLQANKLLPQWKTGRNTMALSYKANEVIVGLNGVAVTDSAASIPTITAGVLGESFNGKIGPVYFYEFPKTLEEIKAITGVTK